MMPGHEKRVLSLDGLRGLGALIVFLYHVDIMVKPFGAGGPSLFPGGASVMVFFILSGIVLSLVPFKHMGNGGYDWLGYYPRRVVRLCVPLFAAIALALPAGYVAWRLGSTSRSALAVAYDAGLPTAVHDILMQFDVLFNVSDGVNNLFGAQLARVDSPVWSMSWELWFSLTLPLAIWCISRIRRTGLAVVATFIAVLVSHWTGYFPLRLCLMFWLGVMVARQFDKIKAVKLSMLAELALLVASVGVIELSLVWHPGGVLEALESTAMQRWPAWWWLSSRSPTGSRAVRSLRPPWSFWERCRTASTLPTPLSSVRSLPCCPGSGLSTRSRLPRSRCPQACSSPLCSGA